jgi:hypothetical protein
MEAEIVSLQKARKLVTCKSREERASCQDKRVAE